MGIRRCIRIVKETKPRRSVKHFFQRRFRGFDDSVTYSLDYSLAKLILPRLKRFREVNIAFPYGMTLDEWNEIIDEMIWTFEFLASEERWLCEDRETWVRAQKGVNLFAKHYFDLWW